MGLFLCENCGCVENTALGFYWSNSVIDWPPEFKGKRLCSECGPTHYPDGTSTRWGQWHGKFPKQSPEECGYVVVARGKLVPASEVPTG